MSVRPFVWQKLRFYRDETLLVLFYSSRKTILLDPIVNIEVTVKVICPGMSEQITSQSVSPSIFTQWIRDSLSTLDALQRVGARFSVFCFWSRSRDWEIVKKSFSKLFSGSFDANDSWLRYLLTVGLWLLFPSVTCRNFRSRSEICRF